jgi:hypothetical protein
VGILDFQVGGLVLILQEQEQQPIMQGLRASLSRFSFLVILRSMWGVGRMSRMIVAIVA